MTYPPWLIDLVQYVVLVFLVVIVFFVGWAEGRAYGRGEWE